MNAKKKYPEINFLNKPKRIGSRMYRKNPRALGTNPRALGLNPRNQKPDVQ
jgi:hypothetical protein